MSDGPVTPIFDPDRGFRLWARWEIYDGVGDGRYVPNVDDQVWSWEEGIFRVVDVNYTTGISTLQEYTPPKEPQGGLSQNDVILNGGAGPIVESYRAYIDTSVMPHTLALDSRLHIYGSTASKVKVFKGVEIGNDANVISRQYDQNGDLVGESIPLEKVLTPEGDNEAIKRPKIGYTIDNLDDGELVTAVVYDDAGNAISVAKLIVKNTAFIRTANASELYVTGIHLESPFISEADSRVLEYPINLPIQASAMMGVVTYSDGSTMRLPINGTKFTLHGLDNYISTILGQRLPLVLTYFLSPDEAVYNSESGAETHVSENYEIVTTEVNGTYTVKLFTYPVWIDQTNGYRLEHFLYNLDRDERYKVTSQVKLAANSPAFNPVEYGITQNLSFAINLNKVDGKFSSYNHVQSVGISLMNEGDVDDLNWTIQYTPGQKPIYGSTDTVARISFIDTEFWNLKIDCNAGSKAEWLGKLYYPTQPLYNSTEEPEAPEPTHFRIVLNDRIIEQTIDQWSAEFQVSSSLDENTTIYVEFFKRTSTTDLELAIAGLPVHQVVS